MADNYPEQQANIRPTVAYSMPMVDLTARAILPVML